MGAIIAQLHQHLSSTNVIVHRLQVFPWFWKNVKMKDRKKWLNTLSSFARVNVGYLFEVHWLIDILRCPPDKMVDIGKIPSIEQYLSASVVIAMIPY